MRILVTGASGVLGRMTVPLLGERGHELVTPSSGQLDLFDAKQVSEAVHDVHAVLHLATRIPTADRRNLPGAWEVNDRLRGDATLHLVDGALSAKIYNICDDTEPVSHDRFTEATGWRPRQTQ